MVHFFQTTNYGLAGLCEPHTDPGGYVQAGSTMPEEKHKIHRVLGDMVATIMAWLNPVQAGGKTAFIYPGSETLIEPQKGTVAFWINTDAKTEIEEKSTHAGCPVLMGTKWILNKWLYSFDQWKTYPCTLNKTDHLYPPFASFA